MSHSQFGEDMDIGELVRDIEVGFAAEIGAYNGVSMSNTLALEERGWHVLCVEPNPYCAASLTVNRKIVRMVACGKENRDAEDFTVFETHVEGNFAACSALNPDPERPPQPNEKVIGTFRVPVFTLDTLLQQVKFPRLDVLSIDVEGGEADVLTGFDIAWWAPKVIVIEDWKGGRFREKFGAHGYRLYRRRNVNEVYVRP